MKSAILARLTPGRLALVLLALIVAVYAVLEYMDWQRSQQLFDYGAPTPLAGEEPMRTVVCEIRRELDALPDRIVLDHHFHEAWSEYKIAAGRFDYRAVHEIELTDEAMAFVLSHSRVELIAALSPLLLDENGGRAAAILGGMPARSKTALAATSHLAETVKQAQGGDPAADINWQPAGRTRYYESYVPASLYGLGNTHGRLERSTPRKYPGSFEERLAKIMSARSDIRGPFITLEYNPAAGSRQTFDEMLNHVDPPVPEAAFLSYVSSFPRQDIMITVFPMLGQYADGNNNVVIDLLWASGTFNRYWPMVIGNPIIEGDPYGDFRSELRNALVNLCDDQ